MSAVGKFFWHFLSSPKLILNAINFLPIAYRIARFFFCPGPRAAIKPTFCPGGAPCEVVVVLLALRLLLPYGCTAGTILRPLVLGYLCPLAFIRWNFSPALRKGFSILPAAETTPIVVNQ